MWATGQWNLCPIASTVTLMLRSWIKITYDTVVDSSRRWFPVTTVPLLFVSPCSLLSLAEPRLVSLWAKIPRSVVRAIILDDLSATPMLSICPAAESTEDSNSLRNTIYHCYVCIYTTANICIMRNLHNPAIFFWVCPPKKSKMELG